MRIGLLSIHSHYCTECCDVIVFVFLSLSHIVSMQYRTLSSINLLRSEIGTLPVKQDAFTAKNICVPGFLSRTSAVIYRFKSCEKKLLFEIMKKMRIYNIATNYIRLFFEDDYFDERYFKEIYFPYIHIFSQNEMK